MASTVGGTSSSPAGAEAAEGSVRCSAMLRSRAACRRHSLPARRIAAAEHEAGGRHADGTGDVDGPPEQGHFGGALHGPQPTH